MIITHKIQTDLIHTGVLPKVNVVQGDYYSREVAVTVLAAGDPWNAPEGVFAAVRYCKPDGKKGSYDTLPDGTKAWALSGNTLTIQLAPQMLTIPGCVNAQCVLICENKILASFPFQIMVERDPANSVYVSEDYFNWHHWLQSQLHEGLESAKESGAFTGLTPNLQIGTVSALPTGSNPTASIRGTAENPLLDLGIPQGADPIVDETLTQSGLCADAKVVGDMFAKTAPSGFGLGGNGRQTPWDDVDSVRQNGWYSISQIDGGVTVNNITFLFAYMHVSCWNESNVVQILYPVGLSGTRLIRTNYGGTWTPWEAENPPMVAGKEYRTTQRYQGSPVYAKCVIYRNNDAIGNTETYSDISIAHGISGLSKALKVDANFDGLYMIPYLTAAGGSVSVTQVTSSGIQLRIVKDVWNSHDWVFFLYYTKE